MNSRTHFHIIATAIVTAMIVLAAACVVIIYRTESCPTIPLHGGTK